MNIKEELISKSIGAVCGLVVSLVVETAIPSLVKVIAKKGSKKRLEEINETIESDDYGPEIVKREGPLTVDEFKERFNKEES